MRKAALATIILGLLTPSTAQAAIITRSFEISATNFVLAFGNNAPAPIAPFSISFTLNWDNAFNVAGSKAGLTVNSFNLPYDVNYSFNRNTGSLIIGTILPSSTSCQDVAGSFCFTIRDALLGAPRVSLVSQTTPGSGYWSSFTTRVQASAYTNPVPEPATWGLMIAGFGLCGAALRRAPRRVRAVGLTARLCYFFGSILSRAPSASSVRR